MQADIQQYLPGMILVLVVSLGLSLALSRLVIGFCLKHDVVDRPGQHKRHNEPVPNIGGVSVLISMIGALSLVWLLFPDWYDTGLPWLHITLGALLIFGVGLYDDLQPVSAWLKLLAQAAAGLLLYFGGIIVDPLYIPFVGEVHPGLWSALIPVFWVTLLSNAINLIDGLDGLATGVGLIGAIAVGAISLLLDIPGGVTLSLALTGALAGVLYFNLYPARLFLGDSGALLVGYLFAVLSLLAPIKSFTAAALFPPLVALAVPLVETFTSFSRRLLAGKNVMKADRRHLFHYLGYLGLSYRATVRTFWVFSALSGAMSIVMLFWDKSLVARALVVIMVAVLALFLILGGRLRGASLKKNRQ
jgi:UDP-GlcNAc:undecaprenyl-phosphate/decaprenyl-phosphate GlcNAc-1-phosphate transferase